MTILFDLDGTLIDSTEAIVESFHTACDTFDFPRVQQKHIEALIGHPLDVMFASVGVEKSRVWDFVAAYKEHYRKVSKQKTRLLPFAKESVELASSFARLGIVTTKTGRYSQELMEHFGLMQHFQTLVGREHVTNPKPHPEPILKAMKQMGASNPQRTWMIGDTVLDLESSLRAGIGAVGVLSGYGSKEELQRYDFELKNDALGAVKALHERALEKN